MFETIKELITEAIGSGDYDTEFEEALETELFLITKVEEDSEFLSCLEAAGVDNWEGYSYAQEMMEEDE